MKNRNYLYDVVMILAGALVVSLDQWSKAAIRQHFVPCDGSTYSPLVGQYFGLTCTYNTGAAFSIFEQGQTYLLFLLIGIALAVIIWLYIRYGTQQSLLLKISFGMILGGAAGNLIDRFLLGHVTDFLLFSIRSIRFYFPVFNLADSSICIGIFLLILYFWLRPNPVKPSPDAPAPEDTATPEETPAERPSSQRS